MVNKPQPPKGPLSFKKVFMVAAIGIIGYTIYQSSQVEKSQAAEAAELSQMIPYTDFAAKAHQKLIRRIDVYPDGKLIGSAPEKPPVLSQQLEGDNLASRLDAEIKGGDIMINVVPPKPRVEASGGGGMMGGGIGTLLIMALLPTALLIGFMYWMQRKQQGGGAGGVGAFGKSKAKLDENAANVTFADVAGCDEAKEEIEEIVDFLKDPTKFSRLGGRIPRGALLVGPPGTGKTLLAKAVAGEAKVPFFSISGSDFVEMFVGVGAARVRDMFENAKKNAPCIVFIDEIDAVGKQRGNGAGGGGNDEREQTLNAMLVEMDGFGADTGVIVIAATNRVDTLDKALLRPGRFDRHVYVGLPDINGREQILKVHARKVPLGDNVNLLTLARGTPGSSGADLANLVNEAALMAARRNARHVEMRDFEEAKDKIFMGPARKSMVMSLEERTNTGKHESGHTIIGKLVPGNDPVHKVTIMPRGQALGLTWSQPDADSYGYTYRQMLAKITMLYGGRIAEEIHASGDMLSVSTGASNDIMRATQMAREMVTRYGFHDAESERPLAVAFYAADDNGQYMINSMEAHNAVTKQVEKILMKCEGEARTILKENVHIMDQMTKDLLEYETLDAEDINMIMRGESIAEKKRQEHQKQVVDSLANSKDRIRQGLANDNKPGRKDPDKFDMK